MSTAEERLRRLRALNGAILERDPKLHEEHADRGTQESMRPRSEGFAESTDSADYAVAEESIVMRRLRPVLAIRHNEARLVFDDTEDSEVWKERLTKAKSFLDHAIRAVGRIDLKDAPLGWVGTGWLVADAILVTNRHVAREFAARDGRGFVFRMGGSGRIKASVDFLQELDSDDTLVFQLIKPLHIEGPDGPDIAFFEIAVTGGNPRLAEPLKLATRPGATANAAVIGYPAYDSRIPDPALMEQIFGKKYNKKRLAPGGVTRVEPTRLTHDCTTLGGNSGSALVDLDTGLVLGLHFSGTFLTANYAVRADIVAKVLDDVRSGRSGRRESRGETLADRSADQASSMPAARQGATAATHTPVPAAHAAQPGTSVSVTIPLTVTVALGAPLPLAGPPARPAPAARAPETDDGVEGEEAVASDYRDRVGYVTGFLGEEAEVALPVVERGARDILDFDLDGKTETVLRYEHFSVVMSRSRRMCFLSAVNIDGNLSQKTKRAPWRFDPRIPRTQQIMKECYGNPPKFSRGHMTRREDPAWGKDGDTAKRGNEDSMHVTNTTPQMQAFNAPIWLELEDYALSHAREDDMKISVFTGPYFTDGDPTMHGVRIPLSFWKIIAFIHDETGELCATGYEMNQEGSLPSDEEFVFGQFTSSHLNRAAQVSVGAIARKAGIDFAQLVAADPLGSDEEGVEAASAAPLESLEQIRFLR